jgi:preprotein translocase subunit YajC
MGFLPIILMGLFFYFFIIRPQSKQRKQIEDMHAALSVGDEVQTYSGFYGIIYAIDDENVVLEMLPDFTKLMISKAAISKIITSDDIKGDATVSDNPGQSAAENTIVEDADDQVTTEYNDAIVEDADYEDLSN